MQSAAVNNDPQASKNLLVEVTGGSPASGCSVDTQGPQVTLRSPAAGAVYPPYPVRFTALADDTKTGNNGISVVEYKVDYPGPTQAILGPGSSSSPFGFDWTQADVEAWLVKAGNQCKRIATVQAYAVDNCGNATFSPSVQITVGTTSTSCVPDVALARDGAALVSDLAVPGGRGQLVVDGTAVFVRDGRSPVTVRGAARQVRVEATLVDARAAGSWRFDLSPMAGVLPDSVQVIAGDVVQAAGGALVFRVQGRPGERIVFSFTTK